MFHLHPSKDKPAVQTTVTTMLTPGADTAIVFTHGRRPVSCSFTFWNETRNAGFYHFIQPLSGLNSIDFVKRVFGKGRDVEILSRAGRSRGRGKQSRAALHRPSQQHLCRGLSNSRGDSRNDWVFEQPRPHPVT